MSRRIAIIAVSLVLAICLSATGAWAVIIGFFAGTNRFIERAQDIVVVEVGQVDQNADDLEICEVRILRTLKGSRPLGAAKLATAWPVTPGKRYLVVSHGGSCLGTDLIAADELSVVPLSPNLDLKTLDDKRLAGQLAALYRDRLAAVNEQQNRLTAERELLELAVETAVDPISKASTAARQTVDARRAKELHFNVDLAR
jgi:hypothetical protein